MDTDLSTYLTGFHGFSRSFNRSVLAQDLRLHQEYREALNNGSLPYNRLRTLTIGDKGVGKSSTLQYLQGKACDPNIEPQSTEGIEITICETSERDPSWKLCSNGVCASADNPGLCAAWCVCAGIDSFGGILHMSEDSSQSPDGNSQPAHSFHDISKRKTAKRGNYTTPRNVFQTLLKLALCALYQIKITVAAVVLFLVFPNTYDIFGVMCWLAIFSSVPFFKGDFNSSFRFTTCVALHILTIDVFINGKEYLSTGSETPAEESTCEMVVVFSCLAVSTFALSIVFGFLCGTGCRSGVAIAFCLMTHQSVVQMHIKSVVAVCIGNIIGLLVLRDVFNHTRNILKSYCLNVFALVTFVVVRQFLPFIGYHVYDVLIGVFMGIGYPYGVLKGREIGAARKLVLPYYVKKSFGFIVAVIIGKLIGWRLVIFSENSKFISVVCSVFAALGFLFYDFLVAQKIRHLENKQGIPITIFHRFLMDSANKDNPITIKLHFWDNAGDSIYQTMQQFFRPAEAVYLLVFNLNDARENGDWQIQRLRQWLFTVKAHSKNPNTLVFIVGTHRDSVTDGFCSSFAAQIEDQLYKDFCGILAINGDKGPMYVVENSRPLDQDGLNLRQSIINISKTTPLMTELFPIRYLSILNKIKDLQSNGCLSWIMTTSDLFNEIVEEGMTIDELHKVLAGLHRTGDVIYRDDDKVLKEYVVISPQALLDVLKAIIRIPPRASRRLTEVNDWSYLEEEGVASLNIIKSVIGSETLLCCVIRLMEAYNLVIPVHWVHQSFRQVPHDNEVDLSQPTSDRRPTVESSVTILQHPNYFIIPSHLPEFTGDYADFWEPSELDEEYIFDFGYVAPDSIFHRLLAKCWYDKDVDERVYKTRGRFRYQSYNFYTIKLHRISVSQNTIQVIILHDEQNRCSLQILQFLRQLLEDIRHMDYPKLPYTCGPVCRSCSTEDYQRVLKVCGDDKEFPTANMPYETFMDQGKYHKVHLTPQLQVTCGRRSRSSFSEASPQSNSIKTSRDFPPISHSISVGEASSRVTVITAGDNARFDIHRDKGLPDNNNN